MRGRSFLLRHHLKHTGSVSFLILYLHHMASVGVSPQAPPASEPVMLVWHLWTKCPPAHPHTCIKLHATFTNRGMELNGSQLGTESCLGVSIKRAGRLFLQILGQLMPRLSPRDSETWLLVMPCATCCAWLYPRCCDMAIWQKVSPKGIMWTGLWRMCRCSSYGKEDGSCS